MEGDFLLVVLALTLSFSVACTEEKTLYIPMISKGFQHQFWQAVKKGAEKAVQITK